ncbi:hypothetical protein [Anabaena sp. CCY 9910]|uniref:hypothetical protein n=1 Tax=Anabaena sp. CCY 9910 TaxID=3103870 RepID=UPI0039DF44DA
MSQETVKLQIPLESLLKAISSLDLEEKRKLWQVLEVEIAQAEEDLLEQDPVVLLEVEEARNAYKSGDYLTIEQYITNRSRNVE